MTAYILSTMTAPVSYGFYDTKRADNPVLRKSITVAGGAGIPSMKSGFGEQMEDHDGRPIWVAEGFVTPVNDADFDLLKEHPIFIKHLEKGLVKVLNNDITGNHGIISRHTKGMSEDGFRQLNKDRLKQRVKVTEASTSTESQYRL